MTKLRSIQGGKGRDESSSAPEPWSCSVCEARDDVPSTAVLLMGCGAFHDAGSLTLVEAVWVCARCWTLGIHTVVAPARKLKFIWDD